jgi:hypothetical protein
MVNLFVRAGILTLLILTAWFLLSTALEGERNNTLLGKIDTVIAEEGAVDAYLEYIESTGDTQRYCDVLTEHIQKQNERLFPLLSLLDQARQNGLQNDYSTVRQRFQAANAKLYFSLKKFDYKCPESNALKQPILYFFPDGTNCNECLIQAQILNEVRDACHQQIQIFAFPVEGGIEPVDLLVKDYAIQKTPSLVIEEKVYEGVQSKSTLNALLAC